MSKIVFIILFFIVGSICAEAALAKDLECYGFVYNHTTKLSTKTKMTVSSYDKNFYTTEIGNYSLWYDTIDMATLDVLTLGVINKKTNERAASTAGWKTLGNTRIQDLYMWCDLPDGSTDEIQINCYDYL